MFLKFLLNENDHLERGVESDILGTKSFAINGNII